MNSVQRAVFPGVLLGSLCLFFLTGWMANPRVVLASSDSFTEAVVAVVVNSFAAPEPRQEAADAEVAVEAAPEASDAEVAPEAAPEAAVVEQSPLDEGCALSAAVLPAVQQWCGLITRYANENGLEPALVAAMMAQESGGNPQAYSSSGAVGLLQIMPRDGLAAGFMCPNGPCFASRPSMNELFDPEFNIAYGTRMLAGLVQKHGSVRDALMKYGPANVGYYYADIILGIYDSYR